MKNQRVYSYLFVFVLALSLTGLVGCNDSGSGGGGSKSGQVTISGRVTGSGGLPGVTVSAGGQEALTDDNGFYMMDEVAVPKDGRLVVSFAKSGKVPATRILEVEGGQAYAVAVSLETYDSITSDLDPAAAISVQADVDSKKLIGLEIPAGSLQGANGNVDVSTFYGDPTTEAGRDAMPGDFMAAASADSEADILLESIAFTEITITDDQGNEITEFAEPAKVSLRLPDDLQDDYVVDDLIPWWSFDEEKGIWVREDADPATEGVQDAVVVLGDDNITLYAEAWVTHLSWWNCDQPIETQSVICVNVYDCETDKPLANVSVEARGVTYNGSSYATTDKDGRACLNVKRSTADLPEKVTLWATKGALKVQYLVNLDADPAEGNEANEVFVPYEQGSTIDGSGKADWLTLSEKLCLSYDGVITGTVTYKETDTPVAGIKVYSDVGVTAETNGMGQYSMKVPRGDLLLYVPAIGSREVTVGVTPVNGVDFELPNRAPVIDQLTMDSSGLVEAGGKVKFIAQASDPDNDPITYAWSATVGSPKSKTGSTFTWTAPDDAGTAVITLTVTDEKGAAITAERSVTYGGTVGGTTLKVTVKDNPESNQPVSGVHVVLYATDDVTIADYKVTNDQGVADFGDIDRETVTVTLAYEEELQNMHYASVAPSTLMRGLHTIIEFPAGDHVYYVDDDSSEDWWNEQPLASVDATLGWGEGGVPADIYLVNLAPFSGSAPDRVNFTDVSIYEPFVQTDGQISLLALGKGTDWYSISKYGFLTDQQIDETTPYEIAMDHDAEDVTWNTVYAGTDDPALIDSITISANRKGVDYPIGGLYYQPAKSFDNAVKVARDFPAESYMVECSGFASQNYLMTVKRFDTLSTAIADLPVPDMLFTDPGYAEGVFTWSTSGTMVPDVISVDYEYYEYSETGHTEFYWEATMAGDKTSWTLPQLPEAIEGWVDRTQIGENGSVSVNADDFDIISSYTQLVSSYLAGNNPYLLSDTIFTVEFSTENQESAFVSSGSTYEALGLAVEEEPVTAPRLKSGLSGFLRQ